MFFASPQNENEIIVCVQMRPLFLEQVQFLLVHLCIFNDLRIVRFQQCVAFFDKNHLFMRDRETTY